MNIIDRKLVEDALHEAKKKMRLNEGDGLSERFVEAKASAEAFQYVLDNAIDNKVHLFMLSQMKFAYESGVTDAYMERKDDFRNFMINNYGIDPKV